MERQWSAELWDKTEKFQNGFTCRFSSKSCSYNSQPSPCNASVNSSCAQPPAADLRALALILCLGWEIPGGGDSWAVESPRMEMKKEGKCLSSINTATFFIDHTVKWCYFKHFFWGGGGHSWNWLMHKHLTIMETSIISTVLNPYQY